MEFFETHLNFALALPCPGLWVPVHCRGFCLLQAFGTCFVEYIVLFCLYTMARFYFSSDVLQSCRKVRFKSLKSHFPYGRGEYYKSIQKKGRSVLLIWGVSFSCAMNIEYWEVENWNSVEKFNRKVLKKLNWVSHVLVSSTNYSDCCLHPASCTCFCSHLTNCTLMESKNNLSKKIT